MCRRKSKPHALKTPCRRDPSEERIGQEVCKLHRPEPVVELNRREQSDVCKNPCPQHAVPTPIEAHHEPEKTSRNHRHDRKRDEGLHAVIASGREHRDNYDDVGEKEPVFVVRRPKLLKSQGPISCLLQKRNELPIVHERDVHGKGVDVCEQKKPWQNAEENQQSFSNDRTENDRLAIEGLRSGANSPQRLKVDDVPR